MSFERVNYGALRLYAATNGGENALTKAAAVEVAKDNISVNSLAYTAQ